MCPDITAPPLSGFACLAEAGGNPYSVGLVAQAETELLVAGGKPALPLLAKVLRNAAEQPAAIKYRVLVRPGTWCVVFPSTFQQRRNSSTQWHRRR